MNSPGRNIHDDYVNAYLAEYESYRLSGNIKKAEAVADVLQKMGHDIRPKATAAVKERAVNPEPLTKAVEDNAAPVVKRRGRPPKV